MTKVLCVEFEHIPGNWIPISEKEVKTLAYLGKLLSRLGHKANFTIGRVRVRRGFVPYSHKYLYEIGKKTKKVKREKTGRGIVRRAFRCVDNRIEYEDEDGTITEMLGRWEA